MKECRICHTIKPLDDFSTRHDMRDGHLNQCKSCINERQRKATKTEPRKTNIRLRLQRWRKEHPEKYRTQWMQWTERCREHINARQRKRYADNPHVREKVYQWRDANHDKVKANQRQAYHKNLEKWRTYYRKWRQMNQEKVRQIQHDAYWRNPERSRARAIAWRRKDPIRAELLRRKHHDKRRMAHANAPYEAISLQEIHTRDRGICQICHRKTFKVGTKTPSHAKAPSLDHIVPVSHPEFVHFGHVRTNVRLAHLGCNSHRKAKGMNAQYLLFG